MTALGRAFVIPPLVVATAFAAAGCGAASRPASTAGAVTPSVTVSPVPATSTAAPATPSGATSATPTPTPGPATDVIARWGSGTETVVFVRPDGSTIGTAATPSAFDYTAADGRFWFIDSNTGHLFAASPNGNEEDFGVLYGEGGASFGDGLAVSPDGRSWAWGVCSTCESSPGPSNDDIYVGGVGVPPRMVYEEQVRDGGTGQFLGVTGWTPSGLIVERKQDGLGGCCYFAPESGNPETMLIAPATGKVLGQWPCGTAFVSPSGSFACVGATNIAVHMTNGSTTSVTPLAPAPEVGWAHVDDARQRVVFSVVHSRGTGNGSCPCVIDTESGNLQTGAVTKVASQVTLDGILSDGGLVVESAPAVLGSVNTWTEWVISANGTKVQLGSPGVVAVFAA